MSIFAGTDATGFFGGYYSQPFESRNIQVQQYTLDIEAHEIMIPNLRGPFDNTN